MATEIKKTVWLGQPPQNQPVQPGKEVKAYKPYGITDGTERKSGAHVLSVNVTKKNLQAPKK